MTIVDDEIGTERAGKLRIVRADSKALPLFAAGAHIDVKINNGWTRSYSLCHLPRADGYRFAVRKSPDGRGGSKHIHEHWKVGDRLLASEPRNHFELSELADRHLLIAGGIGITPFLSMIEQLENQRKPWELHYLTRTVEAAAFAGDLKSRFPTNVTLHITDGNPKKRLDLEALLSTAPLGSHVYCCGPTGLIAAVNERTATWPGGSIHFEAFAPTPTADAGTAFAFDVTLVRSGRVLSVPADTSLLEALLEARIDVPSSCRSGTCGMCQVSYLQGVVDHRDTCLSREARKTMMMACVSRGKSTVTLDL